MNIIACQDNFIMTGVAVIELGTMGIRFENDRYHQFWHFDSEEETKEAFAEVDEEIHNCVMGDRNCILDEAIIKARVRASLNRDHDGEINDKKIKEGGKHAR